MAKALASLSEGKVEEPRSPHIAVSVPVDDDGRGGELGMAVLSILKLLKQGTPGITSRATSFPGSSPSFLLLELVYHHPKQEESCRN